MIQMKRLLDELGIAYEILDENAVDLPDVGGTIYKMYGQYWFVHGNREVWCRAKSPYLKEIVTAYCDGFDEFEEVCEKLNLWSWGWDDDDDDGRPVRRNK